ncbi:16S rRNA (uracil(1498)-N(3))-methyltransferase [Paracoccus shanxieyensis]|uniref:Ribosomal RNA small subunit methyltransferase E n=1 Tax=Paracoccus shanxieyensis TaxID=2675752 RepID=A0A6L6ISA8_9RHOB|nr:16S rRNA (uracil(1498)-N(3))-methyltransferase [Paracoccus shanxieyensis]MTH62749.1 16S rRNA (uracil(1498)-N(3))-methyltransferase [Paracoccus shanxieyensis]MTH86167.1 16S rRNA (uracil(1498)-N(3))-methyltransferase [Paracoccus shanxieyensis]
MAKIRLFIDHPLASGQGIALNADQAHYLSSVMRQQPGDDILLFNGRDGEWLTRIQRLAKRNGDVVALEQSAPQLDPPDLWLIFAPIKKARTDFIVEKAAEMGAARIMPVQTDHTNSERIRQDRLQAHAVEAAEQCGGTFVPEVTDLAPLSRLLDGWDGTRRILWADEAMAGPAQVLAGLAPGPWAILIGPEGGWSESERKRLRTMECVTRMALGPRILRADTAAVAAMSLWQAALGDWR